jgi:iron(III) transport system substrate-binding protein
MKCRILFFVLGLVLAPYNLPRSWGQADHTKRLIEAAMKEGKVVWYTALSIPDAELLAKRFEQTYPFIKTETLRLVTDALLTKILTETKAGVHNADV